MAGGVYLDLPESGVQNKNIEKVLLHEDFNYDLLQNDICLLKVRFSVYLTHLRFISHETMRSFGIRVLFLQTKAAFEWTETVKPVSLPESMSDTAKGTNGTLAGWGEDGVSWWPNNI